MRRRGAFVFVLFNVLISVTVAFGIISLFGGNGDKVTDENVRLATFVVYVPVTTTPNPISVVIVTATPGPGTPEQAVIPDEIRDEALTGSAPVSTIDPTLLDEEGHFVGDLESLPEGCIQHTLAPGEFPSQLSTEYDVPLASIMVVNNLTEDEATLLQVGDVLIIPLEGCPIEAFVTDIGEPDEVEAQVATDDAEGGSDTEATEEPTTIPTATLPPTATSARVEILEVIGVGDITAEGVGIRNNGNTVDISGWTLSDDDGNTYTFPPDRRLFSGAGVTIYSRPGDNTPIFFFWGRDTAVFEPGDSVILRDRNDVAQAALRLPEG